MRFNPHYNLRGKHAWLSASKYQWLNYTPDRLREVFHNDRKKQLGTELHEFAQAAIKLGQKQPRGTRTINEYINDAIGYRMTPEVVLYYSDVIFGSADAVGFRHNVLRVYDLKTGDNPAKMAQLEIYAALWCLEYGYDPATIELDLRIYQNNEIDRFVPVPNNENIQHIMDKIVLFNKIIEEEMEVVGGDFL